MEETKFFIADYSELEKMEQEAQLRLSQIESTESEGEEDSVEDIQALFPEDELLAYPEVGEDFELELDYFDAEKQEEKLWQARTGLNSETLCGAIETVIFMSDRPVSLTKMRKLIDEEIPLRALHEAIARLQEEYESKHHGIRLMEVAEGYQFRTKATYSKYVQDLFNVNALVLTPTALEVLAVIAYKQPVAKTEVDKIRGVDSSHIVRGLMDKRLVKVVGRSEELGRPVLYGTTPEFMEVFNLANLDELPPEHELEQMVQNSVGKVSDIKGLVHAGDKERFKFDEMDELEELSQSIKAISSDTEFTKTVKIEEKRRKDASGEEIRSAFDILEEYIDRQQISDANTDSKNSELFTAVTSPLVIDDLTKGPFNIPEEDLDEDFEMIDLETGEPITFDEVEELDEIEEFHLQDTSFDDLEEEKQALAKALDDAFDRLTNEAPSKALAEEEDLEEGHELFGEKSKELDEWTSKAVEDAKELNIDLDFLKNPGENTDSPEHS